MITVSQIDITEITPGDNDRKTFDPVALQALAESIRQNGLIQPITVRRSDRRRQPLQPDVDSFQIVAGERRFRACRDILGWQTIPAMIAELTDEEASAIMLAENTGRVDLNPIEEARAYQVRIDRFGWSVEEVARHATVSSGLVQRRLSLLQLTPDLQFMVAKGHLPLGHAEAMSTLDHNRQAIAMRTIRDAAKLPPLSAFRQLVSALAAEQSQDALFDLGSLFQLRMAQIEQPRRGRKAEVDAPVLQDLPKPEIRSTDSTATVIHRWITQLMQDGYNREAGVVGTIYTSLVQSNFLSVPLEL